MTAHELALSTMDSPASVSIRLNPFKSPLPEIPSDARKVPWSPWGYILPDRPVFTLDPLFHAGAYYVQDSSAMIVGEVFRRLTSGMEGPLRVLDLCAAPGGKTTDLAASLREKFADRFSLTANETMRQRASILKDNVIRWGDPRITVTSCDPAAFGKLGGYYDVIVTDVPCSGEGMFRKDSRAASEWSEDVVKLCTMRQKRILADVWPALRQGGLLIYSTCTFEESENDLNLQWAARELGGTILPPSPIFDYLPSCIRRTPSGLMLVPGEVPGEGQWVGALRKTAPAPQALSRITDLHPLWQGFSEGEMKGGTLIPDPDSALAIGFGSRFPKVDADRETALKFLHRDSIVLEGAPGGIITICYGGHPLGFVKNLGTRCNTLLPKGRRILMDIE